MPIRDNGEFLDESSEISAKELLILQDKASQQIN